MRAKVQKWGNSLAIRVPRPFADELGLQQDSDVDLLLEKSELVVKPVPRRYALKELLSRVTDQNLHREVTTSASVGDEIW